MTRERKAFRPGDVVIVPFPYTDLTSTKQRPAVVLSVATFNASSPDVVLCGMTSNLADAAYSVLVGKEDLEDGRLMAPSRVKASKIVTIAQTVIRKRVGRLNAATMARVMREFESLF